MSDKFEYAAGRRVKQTNAQQREIRRLYKQVSKEIAEAAKRLENRTNISSVMRKAYLDDLAKEIEKNVEVLNRQIEETIRSNMFDVSTAVVKNNVEYLRTLGITLEQAYFYVPKDIVAEVASGKIYKGRWTLSKAIWSDSRKTIKDIHVVIAKGITENKSAYAIAKDLEKYVDPSARKSWEWSKVYPGTKRVVDYNAQRLARTMVSHAYEESFVRTTKNNPFIEAYKWLISNSDRVCPICISRSEDDEYGLGAGIFPKDALPLDHPNGMCTFEIVRTRSYDEITNDLANWVKGIGDSELNSELDAFAEDLLDRKDIEEVKKSIIL